MSGGGGGSGTVFRLNTNGSGFTTPHFLPPPICYSCESVYFATLEIKRQQLWQPWMDWGAPQVCFSLKNANAGGFC